MPRCSLLAIGNELLNGEIRDLNLHSLGRRLTRLGFTVTGAVISPDQPASIAEGLLFLLDHNPDVVICCGGLGPTEDDLTLSAIAGAVGRPLTLNVEARQMVERHYDQLMDRGYLHQRGPEAARVKMATLPQDAQPLPNPIGTAPGVLLVIDDTRLYVLPGVPAELEAMFDDTVAPQLGRSFESGGFVEQALRVHVDDEADVATPLKEVRHRHPDVYLKSLAQPFPAAGREGLRIIATAQATNADEAEAAVTAALQDLREVLDKAGLRTSAAQGEESVY
ncbi:MAG: competence/damage-inducible protein A [Anaerolineae bacterium]|nr:competence/damage-inducible protein A [Anaerolineae bacterium]